MARLSTTIADTRADGALRASGQFYNWYDDRTGEKLTTWPPTGAPLTPILSSVDNGWLATGLRLVQRSVPELAKRAGRLYDGMDFGFYYRPAVNRIALLLRAEHRRVAVLLRHGRQREPHRELHWDRQGRATTQGVLRHLALVPRHL